MSNEGSYEGTIMEIWWDGVPCALWNLLVLAFGLNGVN